MSTANAQLFVLNLKLRTNNILKESRSDLLQSKHTAGCQQNKLDTLSDYRRLSTHFHEHHNSLTSLALENICKNLAVNKRENLPCSILMIKQSWSHHRNCYITCSSNDSHVDYSTRLVNMSLTCIFQNVFMQWNNVTFILLKSLNSSK